MTPINKFILTVEQCKQMLMKIGIKPFNNTFYDWNKTAKYRYYSKEYRDLKNSVEFHTKNLKSDKYTETAERLYWIFHNIKSYDDYPKCYCGLPVMFRSLKKGLSNGCCPNHNYWKSVVIKREAERNRNIVLTKQQLIEMLNEKKNGKMYIPMLYKNNNFKISINLELKEFPRRYQGLKQFQELCYAILNDLKEPPKCKICGSYRVFWNMHDNYQAKMFCSNKCRNDDKQITQDLHKRNQEKNLKLHGHKEHPNVRKARLASIEKQKVDGYKQFTLTMRKNCMKKYGVEHPMQLSEIKEKVKATYRAKTGYDNPMQNPEHKEKMYAYFMAKYGIPVIGGCSTPKRHNCGIMYQGSHELHFVDTWLKFYERDDLYGNADGGLTLRYNDDIGKSHVYFVDFKIKDKTRKFRLVEVKGSSRFFKYELHEGILKLKCKALYDHYVEHKDAYNPPLFIFNKHRYYWFDNENKIDAMIKEFESKYLNSEYFTKGKSVFGLK